MDCPTNEIHEINCPMNKENFTIDGQGNIFVNVPNCPFKNDAAK